MTTTQRALVVLVPVALAFIVFIRWTWPFLVIAAVGFILFMMLTLVVMVAEWIAEGHWEWPWWV